MNRARYGAAVILTQRSCATVYPVSALLCAILAALITQYQVNTCGSVNSLQSVVDAAQVVNPAFNIQHQEIVDHGMKFTKGDLLWNQHTPPYRWFAVSDGYL